MELVVLSLGGSLICPDKVDVEYLKAFKVLVHEEEKKFIIVCGGGKVCREYLDKATELGITENKARDLIGIRSTQFNAQLVHSMLNDSILKDIHIDYDKEVEFEKYLIGAGFYPGTSSDFDAVMFAVNYGAKRVINLSNIDYVYTADPKKDPDAIKIETTTWKDYLDLVGTEWKAGSNYPFDPIASQKCQEHGIKVVILNGKNLENLKNCIQNKEYIGTTIED